MPLSRSEKLIAAIELDDPMAVARALRVASNSPFTEKDATTLSDWIKRRARRRKYSRSKKPRKVDPYKDRFAEGKFIRPPLDELSSALVRKHPEDIAKHICAGLQRSWLSDIASWIERFFGAAPRGRPKINPIDKTVEAAWLVVNSKGLTAKRAAEAAGKPSNDPAFLKAGERGKYSGTSPRSIERARKRVRDRRK